MNQQVFEESPLVVGAGELWREATEAEFLSAIRDGNLPRESVPAVARAGLLVRQGTCDISGDRGGENAAARPEGLD